MNFYNGDLVLLLMNELGVFVNLSMNKFVDFDVICDHSHKFKILTQFNTTI